MLTGANVGISIVLWVQSCEREVRCGLRTVADAQTHNGGGNKRSSLVGVVSEGNLGLGSALGRYGESKRVWGSEFGSDAWFVGVCTWCS